jgi:hypothetical protein
MKTIYTSLLALVLVCVLPFLLTSCGDYREKNTSALDEQKRTEINQRDLNRTQPAPKISWSLERDNLIKRFKLQNDRSVLFYMYVFIEGVAQPIGYYQVNKVSSVNSQLTNPMQIVTGGLETVAPASNEILPSPAEDGSYGTNGDAVFGFTPEEIYIEHNMHYMASTVPLSFPQQPQRLTIINVKTEQSLKEMMARLR